METMITLKEIAQMAGVSRGTVDRVLNHRGGVSEETARKVQTIVDSVGYVPNSIGRTLAISRKNIRLGYLIFQGTTANPFFTEVLRGVEEKENELKSFGVTVLKASSSIEDETGAGQIEKIDRMVAEGVQGLAITPFGHPAVAKRLKELSAAGIPVVTVNSDLEDSDRLCYVGSDYKKAGEVAGGLMGLFQPQGGKVGIISGSPMVTCHVEREKGFREILQKRYPGLTIEAVAANQDDDFISFDVTRQMLAAHPEITGLYIVAGGVYGACRAVCAAGRQDSVAVISHDKAESTLQMLKDGILNATIGQEAERQGSEPLQILYDYLSSGTLPAQDVVHTCLDICIRETIA